MKRDIILLRKSQGLDPITGRKINHSESTTVEDYNGQNVKVPTKWIKNPKK